MTQTFFEKNFVFRTFALNKYHYTDSRSGSAYNYIAYMKEGRCRLVCKYKTVEIQKGDCFFIPRGLAYESFWFGNDKISFISLGFANIPCEERQSFTLQKISCDSEVTEKIKKLRIDRPVSAELLSAFYAILSDLLPIMQNVPKSKEQQLADEIKDYIMRNPCKSIPEIIEECYISKTHLYYIFKKVIKKTPNDFRYEVLCREAVNLLLSTDRKVEYIAEALNFSSTSYFRKILKKYTGKTPKEIRQSAVI